MCVGRLWRYGGHVHVLVAAEVLDISQRIRAPPCKKTRALGLRAVAPRKTPTTGHPTSPSARGWCGGVHWGGAHERVMVEGAADAPNPPNSTKKPKSVVLLSTRYFESRWAERSTHWSFIKHAAFGHADRTASVVAVRSMVSWYARVVYFVP